MNTRDDPNAVPGICLDDPVSAVLARSAGVVDVFVRRRMACPGCAVAPFMTLAEAAATYRLDPLQFLAEIQAALQEPKGPTGQARTAHQGSAGAADGLIMGLSASQGTGSRSRRARPATC
jgi:hybrid cluster-associated redox disulfide protein